MTTEEFIEKAKIIHSDKYDYSKTVYNGSHEEVVITCPKHGDFSQVANYHLCGHGCQICGNNLSNGENELFNFIKSLGVEAISKDRETLGGNKEIDVLVPEKMVGFEYDGLVWHSDVFKDRMYHIKKTEECSARGVRLIHIFEDEWVRKQEIVKSMISHILGKSENKIMARKCVVRPVSAKEKKEFLNENHIQGDTQSSVNIGLFYEGNLVSVMTFGPRRINLGSKTSEEGEYEMIRFCNRLNTSVIGGPSKLLTYFKNEFHPNKIVSYCDRRYSEGRMYETLGFRKDHYSQPNYFYIVGNNRENRYKYRKSELIKKGFDENKSEREIMNENGVHRIYDCGTIVYVWTDYSHH